MSILKTVSGIAKSATGQIEGFRKVLDLNPSAIAFTFPPQVQMGLKAVSTAASIYNSISGSKLKVPTEADLKAIATGQLDIILKGARREVLGSLDTVEKRVKNAADTLNRIDWLL